VPQADITKTGNWLICYNICLNFWTTLPESMRFGEV